MSKMKMIALDTEYTGRIPKPFIASICDSRKDPIVFDLRNRIDLMKFKSILENNDTIIFHQAAADIYALLNIGIDLRYSHKIIDTMIIAQLVNENYESRKLKKLAQIYLNEPCKEEQELKKAVQNYKRICKKNNTAFSYDMIPKNIIFPYAKQDCLYTWNLYHFFIQKHNINLNSKLFKLETALVPIIVNMTKRGVLIDRDYCKQEIQKLKQAYVKAYNEIISLSNQFLNPASSKQIREFVNANFPELLHKKSYLTEKGNFSTNKDVLKFLKNDYPIFSKIEKYRRAKKIISTYYKPLLTEYTSDDDNDNANNSVAHFSFFQSGAKTGRFSAELIQTIPRERESDDDDDNNVNAFAVRRAFIVRPGYVNFYFDYNQIEMRVFAHFSKNRTLIDSINKGVDPHQATANDLFDVKNATEEQRRIAKTINFSLIYGMGLAALLQKLSLSEKEGYDILNRYNKKFRIREYINSVTQELYRKGHLYVDWIGRYYYLPKDLAYKGINAIIQGSSAYIMKLGMLSANDTLKSLYPDANLLLTIHDELVFEIPKKKYNNNKFVHDIKASIESTTLFEVPITVGVKYTEDNWGELKTWKDTR